jgi:chromosome segregation ATPase
MFRNIDSINDMPINQSQIQMKPTYNNLTTPKNSNRDIINSKNNKIMNNIFQDLNDIKNEELINYKKLNDLYLYGDYLEKELKVSNDENVKLLEKFKVMKIQVHSLNQKNNKLKQNIEILSKKEKEISKINDELKNGFDFVQNNLGNNENNEEKMNILNELELNNKKHIEMQTEYEKEIENLKKKISLLVDNDDEENDEDEKMIKALEDKINKDKKELEDKNVEYML